MHGGRGNFIRKARAVGDAARALAKLRIRGAVTTTLSLSVTESVASGSIIPRLELGGEAAIMVISSKEPLVFLPRYLCTSPPCVVVRWLERLRGMGEGGRRRKLPMTH